MSTSTQAPSGPSADLQRAPTSDGAGAGDSTPPPMELPWTARVPVLRDLLWGLLALGLAGFLAVTIGVAHSLAPGQPERGVQLSGIVFVLLAIGVAIATWVRRAWKPEFLAPLLVCGVALFLAGIYWYRISHYVAFPGDFLIWSESDFVQDVVKLQTGYPLYTDEANNESFIYTPGAQFLSFLLVALTGGTVSVPMLRALQVGLMVLAVLVSLRCWAVIVAESDGRPSYRWIWAVFATLVLFLAAGNRITNTFTHLLHNDALVLLLTAVAYVALLSYASTGRRGWLVVMAVVPTLGFWVKQSLAIWAPLALFYLVFFDPRRTFRGVVTFGAVSFGLLATTVAIASAAWGEQFWFWVVYSVSEHAVSPLRSIRHFFIAWPYYVMGLVGGLALLRGPALRRLAGPWLIWLLLLGTETYTSGIAWMTNHLGPGSLLAALWFAAAVTVTAPRFFALQRSTFERWLHPALAAAIVVLLLSGMGVSRIPVREFPADATRYVQDIEAEFAGMPADRVLLDLGSWIYARDGVVMKDRAAAIGELGYSGVGDWSGIMERLETHHYQRILVRNLHEPAFWYDDAIWDESSGIRDAFLRYYEEVRRIPAVTPTEPEPFDTYAFGEISVLEPRTPRPTP